VLHNAGEVSVARRNTTTELVEQSVLMVPKEQKRDLLSHLIRTHKWEQVLVFTRTKHGANRLAEKLAKDGITAAAIHGNKSQSARTKALAGFKEGNVTVLVATDIAARGIDMPEDYVHRIGRTGRAGSSGAAVSLVDNGEEGKFLADIERLIKRKIDRMDLPEFVVGAPDNDERPPRPQGQRHGRPSGGSSRSGAPGGRSGAPGGSRSGAPSNAPRSASGAAPRGGNGVAPSRSPSAQPARAPQGQAPRNANGNAAAARRPALFSKTPSR
jgi:ATP-dependent RNA helicase RhlE